MLPARVPVKLIGSSGYIGNLCHPVYNNHSPSFSSSTLHIDLAINPRSDPKGLGSSSLQHIVHFTLELRPCAWHPLPSPSTQALVRTRSQKSRSPFRVWRHRLDFHLVDTLPDPRPLESSAILTTFPYLAWTQGPLWKLRDGGFELVRLCTGLGWGNRFKASHNLLIQAIAHCE